MQFRTVFGDVEVELYDQDKPVTVQNFLNYIESGRYQNEIAHRLVPGFVLQGGGFTLSNNVIGQVSTLAPITNEFGVGRQFSNVYGTIAMAKLGGNTNSATSQWFFNLTNNAFLDAPDANDFFVVFGHVIAGTNVLNIFNAFQNYTGTQQSNLVANIDANLNYAYYPNFASCPLRLSDHRANQLHFRGHLAPAGCHPPRRGRPQSDCLEQRHRIDEHRRVHHEFPAGLEHARHHQWRWNTDDCPGQ